MGQEAITAESFSAVRKMHESGQLTKKDSISLECIVVASDRRFALLVLKDKDGAELGKCYYVGEKFPQIYANNKVRVVANYSKGPLSEESLMVHQIEII